jgi:hypothetical protein
MTIQQKKKNNKKKKSGLDFEFGVLLFELAFFVVIGKVLLVTSEGLCDEDGKDETGVGEDLDGLGVASDLAPRDGLVRTGSSIASDKNMTKNGIISINMVIVEFFKIKLPVEFAGGVYEHTKIGAVSLFRNQKRLKNMEFLVKKKKMLFLFLP